jgi:hypothetical protein
MFVASGPFLGGFADAAASWRLAVVLPAIAALLIPAVSRIASNTVGEGRVDRTGAVLLAVAISGLVLILQGPGLGVRAALVGAALLMPGGLLLVRHQRRFPNGFTPRVVVGNPAFWLNALVGAAYSAAYLSILLSVPVRLATTEGWSAAQIGTALVPATAMGPLASVAGKRLMIRYRARSVSGVGVVVAGVGAGLATLNASVLAQVTGFGLALLGFGLAQPALIDRISRATERAYRGVAIGLFNVVFYVGGATGSALVGSFGYDRGSVVAAALAAAGGTLLAIPHRTPYDRCVHSTGTIAGAIHCLPPRTRPIIDVDPRQGGDAPAQQRGPEPPVSPVRVGSTTAAQPPHRGHTTPIGDGFSMSSTQEPR